MADMQKMSIAEIRDFRDQVGFGVDVVPDNTTDKLLATAGMYWVIRRRDEPGYTYDDALKLDPSKLETLIEEIDPDDAEDADPLASGAPGSTEPTPPPSD